MAEDGADSAAVLEGETIREEETTG